MDIDKKITELYILGESEGINFLNKKLFGCNGSINRFEEIVLIYINLLLNGKKELLVLSHEMGHYFEDTATELSPPIVKQIDESHACDWAAVKLVTYKDFKNALRNPFVRNDFEAAEELGVDIETVERARKYYERKGLAVKQHEVVNWIW